MKAKYLGFFLLATLVLLGAVACGSTPDAEESFMDTGTTGTAAPAGPDQASLNNLNTAAARAEEARKLAEDFNGPDFYPAEWDSAEALYNQAQSARSTATPNDVQQSLARYNAAAAAYEALAEDSIARYAEVLEQEIIVARIIAIDSGAAYLAPDYLSGTDAFTVEALALYQAGDYYKARDSGLEARDAYNALGVGVQAYKIRLELEDRDFVYYDAVNIQEADAIALSALDDYEARDIASALSKANDVRARYARSLNLAKESFAADCAAIANAERQRALDLKANVAVKQEYDIANGVFIQGTNFSQRGEFDQAASLFIQSRAMFEAVSISAHEKRLIAEEALRAAESKMVESDEVAQRAELIIEGGAR